MANSTKISLFSGAALIAFAIATPVSAAPAGSYQQTCRDIQQRYDETLSAECQTRDGSWVRARLESTSCSGDIANIDGRLVCSDGGRQSDRIDHNMHGDGGENHSGDQYGHYDNQQQNVEPHGHYGSRSYDNQDANDEILSRAQLVRRLAHQRYYAAHNLRPINPDDEQKNWRALASWHGRRVVVRLDPYTGHVIAARYF